MSSTSALVLLAVAFIILLLLAPASGVLLPLAVIVLAATAPTAGVLLMLIVLAAAPVLLLIAVLAIGGIFEADCKAIGGVLCFQLFCNDGGDVKRL
jgi:hypothetical protein